jgi:hypothetical protein
MVERAASMIDVAGAMMRAVSTVGVAIELRLAVRVRWKSPMVAIQ